MQTEFQQDVYFTSMFQRSGKKKKKKKKDARDHPEVAFLLLLLKGGEAVSLPLHVIASSGQWKDDTAASSFGSRKLFGVINTAHVDMAP